MHTNYSELQQRLPDFIVEYEIALCEELKNAKPHQGMRTDFLYESNEPQDDGIYMIWPEFLDQNGLIITDTSPAAVDLQGKANMWIVSDEMKQYHYQRLKVGTKGYWVRGSYKVAKVTVIEICNGANFYESKE